MTQISSRITWSYKWLTWAFLFGTGLVMTAAFLLGPRPNPMLALVVIVLFVGGAWFHRWMCSSIVDRVDDRIDHLLVRRGGREEQISFRDIEAVTMRQLGSGGWAPIVLDVRLRRSTSFGNEITFMPALGWTPDAARILGEELHYRARRHRAISNP
jgi:hypothetical protein